jgi:hypothetical protein
VPTECEQPQISNMLISVNPTRAASSPPTESLAVLDTGAASHCIKLRHAPCTDITAATVPISVHLPDKSTMQNSHEGYLNLPPLSTKACKTCLFDDLQSSLASIGQLCNDGCTATFTKHNVFIF